MSQVTDPAALVHDSGLEPPGIRRPLSPFSRVALAALVFWFALVAAWGASHGLGAGRFYDERFSFENAHSILSGNNRPANGWYPSLAWMPQTALLALSQQLYSSTGWEGFDIYEKRRPTVVFSATSYLIARLVSVAYGALGLIAAFRLGNRLFGERTALLGTVFLAFSPWMLRPAMEFKPDALLTLMILVTLYWSLGVSLKPSLRGYLLVGLGVGLCLATKQNGAAAAIPIMLATVILGRKARRCFAGLVAAGLASLLVFAVLNPWLRLMWSYLGRHARFYNQRDASPLDMFLEGVRFIVAETGLGLVVGSLGLTGLGLLTVIALRRRVARWLQLLMFVSFPLGYWALLVATANYPKDNNYVLLLPFTALAAAWLAVEVWGRLVAAFSLLSRPAVGTTALAALILTVAVPAHVWAWSTGLSGSTYDAAAVELRKHFQSFTGKIVYFESEDQDLVVEATGQPGNWASRHRVQRLSDIDPAVLDLADIEVFRADRLEGPDAAFYEARIDALEGRPVVEVRPRLLRISGPSLVVLVHAWRQTEDPVELAPADKTRSRTQWDLESLPGAGSITSFQLILRGAANSPADVMLDDSTLAAWYGGWRGKDQIYVTERFRMPAGAKNLTVGWTKPLAARTKPRLLLHTWAESDSHPGRAQRRHQQESRP